MLGLVSGGDPCNAFGDVATWRWWFDDLVDGGGLGRASVEGCGEGVERVSSVWVGEMCALNHPGFDAHLLSWEGGVYAKEI